MVKDLYRSERVSLVDPALSAAAVTPSDTVDLAYTTRAVYVGVAGDVAVHMKGQTASVVFKNVPIGVLQIRADRVMATGTTASEIIAMW